MKSTLTSLAAILFSFSQQAQVVNIPDVNFKKYLVGNSSINTNGDNEIDASEAAVFNGGIYVYSSGIVDLTGIEAFTALEELRCYSNSLTSLDVSKNKALTRLICNSNLITSLDVSNNIALELLRCGSNLLTSLDFSKNNALTYLDCVSNKLTSLNVSNNNVLKELSCSSNSLTNLNVSNNYALDLLRCDSNSLTSLDVSKNTALYALYCNNNKLTNLDISNNKALLQLNCHFNSLTSLDFSNNNVLTDLQCQSNLLTSINISNNTALEWLQCQNNLLTNLDVSNNKVLTFLNCRNNLLTNLNVNNGNNVKMVSVKFIDNLALKCIQVDNETWANASVFWTSNKDPQAMYSNDCKAAGIEAISLDKASITSYSNILSINGTIGTITVFGLLGQQVHQSQLTSGLNTITIDGSGVYLVIVQTEKGAVTKKVYLN